jgi:P27 family predicted phage terminase small subunit
MKPGPRPKPYLAAVREGNPGHRVLSPGAVFPSDEPIEPDWEVLLPGRSADAKRVRADVREIWDRLCAQLVRSTGMNVYQQDAFVDLCVTGARIRQGERALSIDGPVIQGERGLVRNPWVTVLNQYRSHWRQLLAEFGLTPSAATRIVAPIEDDEDDVFD